MANKRMFSMKIVDTDAFMDMPQSSQLLYFHLSMRADDDGFISSPKKIMRMIGSSEDDYKVLIAKKFIVPFESGVCVVKHWLIHNLIRSDRYTETQYTKEKQFLTVDEKTKKYSLNKPTLFGVIPDGNQAVPQVRLGKVRLGKVKGDKPPTLFELFDKDIKTNDLEEKNKFIDYWTEKSPNGKKELWQKQRTFDVSRRWARWLGNKKEWDKSKGTDESNIYGWYEKIPVYVKDGRLVVKQANGFFGEFGGNQDDIKLNKNFKEKK